MSYDKEQALQKEIEALRKEQETPLKAEETKASPVEVETPVVESESTAYAPKDEWEEKALKIGWKPDHGGQNFVDAKEYVLRKPLFERIEKQTDELRKLKAVQAQNANNLAQVRKEAYEQAVKALEEQRDMAIDEANSQRARHLDSQVKTLNAQMQKDPIINAAQSMPQKLAEVEEFEQRSQSWYNTSTVENAKMAATAEAVDKLLAKAAQLDGRPIDVKAHIAAIESEVKRAFPHRFAETKSSMDDNKPLTSVVGKSTAPTKMTSSRGNLADRLSPQQRAMGETFAKSNPEYTLEVYAKELDRIGRLK